MNKIRFLFILGLTQNNAMCNYLFSLKKNICLLFSILTFRNNSVKLISIDINATTNY